MYQWIRTIEKVHTIMTPYFVLRAHNNGKRKVDVDGGSRHGDDWGRTLREEDGRIDGGERKSKLRKETSH